MAVELLPRDGQPCLWPLHVQISFRQRQKLRAFSRSRHAINYWLESLPQNVSRLALPELICPELVSFLQDKYDLVPYELDKKLNPNLRSLTKVLPEIDALIVTSYFGTSPVWNNLKQFDIPIFLDLAQSYPSTNQIPYPASYSLRKFLPDRFSLNSSLLLLPNERIETYLKSTSIKGDLASFFVWCLNINPCRRPKTLQYLDHEPEINQRKYNATRIVNFQRMEARARSLSESIISLIPKDFVLFPHDQIPRFGIPVKLNSTKRSIREFHEMGIHCYSWPGFSGNKSFDDAAIKFMSEFLIIPVQPLAPPKKSALEILKNYFK